MTEREGIIEIPDSKAVVRDAAVGPDGRVWCATAAGVWVFTPATSSWKNVKGGLQGFARTAVARVGDELWFGSAREVHRVPPSGQVGRVTYASLLHKNWSPVETCQIVKWAGNVWIFVTVEDLDGDPGVCSFRYKPQTDFWYSMGIVRGDLHWRLDPGPQPLLERVAMTGASRFRCWSPLTEKVADTRLPEVRNPAANAEQTPSNPWELLPVHWRVLPPAEPSGEPATWTVVTESSEWTVTERGICRGYLDEVPRKVRDTRLVARFAEVEGWRRGDGAELPNERDWKEPRCLRRVAAWRALAEYGVLWDGVVADVHHSESAVAQTAAWHLGALGGKRAVAGLCEVLSPGPARGEKRVWTGVRAAAVRALAKIGDPAAAAALATELDAPQNRDGEIAIAAMSALTAMGGPTVVAEVAAKLGSGTALGRQCAAIVLGRIRGAEAVPALAKQLRHPMRAVRLACVEALRLIGGHEAAQALAGRLTDPHWSVQEAAAKALGDAGDPSVVPALKQCSSNVTWLVRRAAEVSLQRLTSGSPAVRVVPQKQLLPLRRRLARRVEPPVPVQYSPSGVKGWDAVPGLYEDAKKNGWTHEKDIEICRLLFGREPACRCLDLNWSAPGRLWFLTVWEAIGRFETSPWYEKS